MKQSEYEHYVWWNQVNFGFGTRNCSLSIWKLDGHFQANKNDFIMNMTNTVQKKIIKKNENTNYRLNENMYKSYIW